MINRIHNTYFMKQVHMNLSKEMIPVQAYEDEAEHSNPLPCLCPCLQMCHSECGEVQGETSGFSPLFPTRS